MEIRRLVLDFLFLPDEDVCFLSFFRGCLTSIGGLSGIEAVLVVEDVSIPSDFFCLIFFIILYDRVK